MDHGTWQKVVAAAAAKGVSEQRLYDDRSLCSKFAAQIGRRGGKVTAKRRRKSAKTAAAPAVDTPKQLTLNLF